MTKEYMENLDLRALLERISQIENDVSGSKVKFRVKTNWQGKSKSRSIIDSYNLGGKEISRHFEVDIDEPSELFGDNEAPNPQEMLLSALNACLMSSYVTCAAMHLIKLDHIEIESSGELDLRGFLGLNLSTKPGYEALNYKVKIKGDATESQIEMMHKAVMSTSPSLFNMERPIKMLADLEIL